MEDYGYMLTKLQKEVKEFSTTKHLNLKPVQAREHTHVVFFVGIVLIIVLLKYC